MFATVLFATALISDFAPQYKEAGSGVQKVDGLLARPISAGKNYSFEVGQNGYRFETRAGDFWFGDLARGRNDRIRSELAEDINSPKLSYGVEYWISYSYKLSCTPGFLSSAQTGGWFVAGQIHQTAGKSDTPGASPPFAFYLDDQGVVLSTHASAESPLVHKPGAIARYKWTGFVQDKWVRVVIKFRLDPTGRLGELYWWNNGKLVYAGNSIPLGYASDQGAYWQFGIYYGPGNVLQNATAYYENMEGPTTMDLSQRIRHPLPVK